MPSLDTLCVIIHDYIKQKYVSEIVDMHYKHIQDQQCCMSVVQMINLCSETNRPDLSEKFLAREIIQTNVNPKKQQKKRKSKFSIPETCHSSCRREGICAAFHGGG